MNLIFCDFLPIGKERQVSSTIANFVTKLTPFRIKPGKHQLFLAAVFNFNVFCTYFSFSVRLSQGKIENIVLLFYKEKFLSHILYDDRTTPLWKDRGLIVQGTECSLRGSGDLGKL